jgi:protein tyrosine/serine phosphatase
MPRYLATVFALFIIALLVGGTLGYASYRNSQMRNLRVVEESVLYRSGQLTLSGLQRVVNDYRIKTVISLRDSDANEKAAVTREENWCRKEEINYYRFPPQHWSAVDGPAPVEENVQQFRAIVADPANYPILVHCFAGIHRTGAYCAVFRMEQQHWTNEAAIAEMRACGYFNLKDEEDILGYLESYRPSWLQDRR